MGSTTSFVPALPAGVATLAPPDPGNKPLDESVWAAGAVEFTAGCDTSGGATVAGGAGGVALSVGWQLANKISKPATIITVIGVRDMDSFLDYV